MEQRIQIMLQRDSSRIAQPATARQPGRRHCSDHSGTSFPLTGAHAGQQCSPATAMGNTQLFSTTCESCHLQRFNSATNPNHVAAGSRGKCSVCHSTSAWTPALFQSQWNQLSADGAHAGQQVFGLPQKRAIRRLADDVHLVPSCAFQWNNESKSCCSGIPAGLHGLPQHDSLDAGIVQSQWNQLSADGRSRGTAVFGLPQQWANTQLFRRHVNRAICSVSTVQPIRIM